MNIGWNGSTCGKSCFMGKIQSEDEHSGWNLSSDVN